MIRVFFESLCMMCRSINGNGESYIHADASSINKMNEAFATVKSAFTLSTK